jgi:hypothetical protein
MNQYACKVTKRSVRKQLELKRLPRRFRMLVDGGWLYHVLEANRLNEKIHLWGMRYWVRCRSLGSKLLAINWRVDK